MEETWLKAIGRGNYNSWPLIDTKTVQKYFPESEETQQGHMRGQRQNVQSTKQKTPVDCTTEPSIEKKQDIFVHVLKLNQNDCLTATIYGDQTGNFPHISSRGNRSIMLLHHVDSNSSWVEPLKNQTEGSLIAARMQALERMRRQANMPKQ